jgi:hypothetical protein
MSEMWKARFLYVVGAWNILGGVSALTDPRRHFAQLYSATPSLEDPLQAFFFRATWINVTAWGVGYILAGRFAAARGPILIAGGLGKLAYFCACLALFTSGVGNSMLMTFGALDVVLAAFFLYVLVSRRAARPAAVQP